VPTAMFFGRKIVVWQKKFAMKMIIPIYCYEVAIEEIRAELLVSCIKWYHCLYTAVISYQERWHRLTTFLYNEKGSKEILTSHHNCLVWLHFKCQQYTAVLGIRTAANGFLAGFLLVTAIEPACLQIFDCQSCSNRQERFTSCMLVDAMC
jgi:hypothetical protein